MLSQELSTFCIVHCRSHRGGVSSTCLTRTTTATTTTTTTRRSCSCSGLCSSQDCLLSLNLCLSDKIKEGSLSSSLRSLGARQTINEEIVVVTTDQVVRPKCLCLSGIIQCLQALLGCKQILRCLSLSCLLQSQP